MNETENKKMRYEFKETHNLSRIAIKLSNSMTKILMERIKEAQSTNRGVNILLEGENLVFRVANLESSHGNEIGFSFSHFGNIKVLSWNPEIAYNGSKEFWIEGFK